jgi:hypothetical protein
LCSWWACSNALHTLPPRLDDATWKHVHQRQCMFCAEASFRNWQRGYQPFRRRLTQHKHQHGRALSEPCSTCTCCHVPSWALLLPTVAAMQTVSQRQLQCQRLHHVQGMSSSLHHTDNRCNFCI